MRLLILQISDELGPPGQGGQMDAVRGQLVALERRHHRRRGRMPPSGGERAEGGEQVGAQVAADELVDGPLPGGIGVPRRRVRQPDGRVEVGGESAGHGQLAGRPVRWVGAEALAQLQVDGPDHPPGVPPPLPAREQHPARQQEMPVINDGNRPHDAVVLVRAAHPPGDHRLGHLGNRAESRRGTSQLPGRGDLQPGQLAHLPAPVPHPLQDLQTPHVRPAQTAPAQQAPTEYFYYVCQYNPKTPSHVAAAPDHPRTVQVREDLLQAEP